MEHWQLKSGATDVLEMGAPSGKSILFMQKQEHCMTGLYLAVNFRHRVKTGTWTVIKNTRYDRLSILKLPSTREAEIRRLWFDACCGKVSKTISQKTSQA
jgi:hypothetical protein